MNRRDFVKGVASAAVLTALPDLGATAGRLSVDGHVFPDWALNPILDGVARYRAWKGDDETVAFPIMTDCHSKFWGFSAIDLGNYENLKYATVESLNLDFRGAENWNDPKLHILLMRKLAHLAGADFIADLGDHDFQFFAFKDPIPLELARAAMLPFRKLYETETLPTLFARGNHDHSCRRIPDEEYGEKFNRSLNAKKNLDWKLSTDGTFGYYDIPAKKFRAVFLNSSRKYVNGLDAEELQFMADAFASAPEGWTVIELEHIPIPPIMNRSRRGALERVDRNMGVAYGIVEDFTNHRGRFNETWNKSNQDNVYTLQDKKRVTWNFEKSRALFAGAFFGHNHVEEHLRFGGVNWTTRPGYGTTPAEDLCGEKHDPKNGGRLPKDTILLDLVAIKPTKRKVHVFRCGLGDPASDLEYAYAQGKE